MPFGVILWVVYWSYHGFLDLGHGWREHGFIFIWSGVSVQYFGRWPGHVMCCIFLWILFFVLCLFTLKFSLWDCLLQNEPFPFCSERSSPMMLVLACLHFPWSSCQFWSQYLPILPILIVLPMTEKWGKKWITVDNHQTSQTLAYLHHR